jgi:hypothetical protein
MADQKYPRLSDVLTEIVHIHPELESQVVNVNREEVQAFAKYHNIWVDFAQSHMLTLGLLYDKNYPKPDHILPVIPPYEGRYHCKQFADLLLQRYYKATRHSKYKPQSLVMQERKFKMVVVERNLIGYLDFLAKRNYVRKKQKEAKKGEESVRRFKEAIKQNYPLFADTWLKAGQLEAA